MSDIVLEAQWQCRNCERVFDTRGKRDAHQRKEHQKIVTTYDQSNQRTRSERSITSKDFFCSCGKTFSHTQSFQRHAKSCNRSGLFVGGENVGDRDSHEDEGTITFRMY